MEKEDQRGASCNANNIVAQVWDKLSIVSFCTFHETFTCCTQSFDLVKK